MKTDQPKILSIDTSTDRITLSVSKGKEILLDESSIAEHNHSKKILRLIDNALKKINLKIEEIDAFATTIGPGSFTGLRTSLGTLKGLCFSLEKPLIGIPSLYALAFPAVEYKTVMPIIEAKKDFFYTSLFQYIDDRWVELEVPRMISIEELKTISTKATLVGHCGKRYRTQLPSNAKLGNSKFDAISGITLSQISHRKYINKEFEDVLLAEPLYIQKTAAEGYV